MRESHLRSHPLGEARRFYKAHIMGSVGALAADATIAVRAKAAHVLGSTAQHARALGDTDMGLKAEGLRREAPHTTLAQDASNDTSACAEEVQNYLMTLSIMTLSMPGSGPAHAMRPASHVIVQDSQRHQF